MIAGIEFVFGSFLQFCQSVRCGWIEIYDRIAIDQEFNQAEEENRKVDRPDKDEDSD